MSMQPHSLELDDRPEDNGYNSGSVAVSFIEYTAYFLIVLGLLYFLAQYVIPTLNV